MGDFNVRSRIWGDSVPNDNGEVTEEQLQFSYLCTVNTGTPTYLHKQPNTLTCVDLALATPDIFLDMQ